MGKICTPNKNLIKSKKENLIKLQQYIDNQLQNLQNNVGAKIKKN